MQPTVAYYNRDLDLAYSMGNKQTIDVMPNVATIKNNGLVELRGTPKMEIKNNAQEKRGEKKPGAKRTDGWIDVWVILVRMVRSQSSESVKTDDVYRKRLQSRLLVPVASRSSLPVRITVLLLTMLPTGNQ
jgi:hypothetical protein